MYLLDTNTVINYLNAVLQPSGMHFIDNVVDEFCNISVITKMEVLGFDFTSVKDQKIMETSSAMVPVN